MEKPKCKLVGTDDNVFAIISKVSATLKKAGETEKAKEFETKAFACESYNAVLNLTHEYVKVS